jgi:phosphoribosyl-ATP pyrophosphohydrolase/phosphoribosyl-AMP cyclohydrolase
MVIPSIDLSQGKTVQLEQGKKKKLERDDTLALADEFSRYGEIAVVDLDAALGRGSNDPVIQNICRRAACRVGGGIRSVDRAAEVLSWGADKIIVGTMAFAGGGVGHDFLAALRAAVGRERIIIAVDTLHGRIVTEGWQKETGSRWQDVIRELEPYAAEFLFTSVEKEGLMKGPDFAPLRTLQGATTLPVTIAGGISSIGEVRRISRLGFNAQLGMALYTGKISLPDAFVGALDWEKGLIPTVTVDAEGQVMMLAYSSKSSLAKTFATGTAWYYSRSRRRLWQKGETSGNFQKFLKVRADCDRDALVLTVDPRGPACHTGSYSCFGAKEFSPAELFRTIRDRLENPAPQSYTSRLTADAARDKLTEEVGEFLDAPNRENLIWEAADVLYFLQVILAQSEVSWGEVMGELKRRRRSPRRPDSGTEKEEGK